MLSDVKRLLRRLHEEDAGITALETAIILIAFVVVASVFAFTMLSAGTFSTERGKEAIYAGLSEVQSSMVIKGSVLAITTQAAGADAELETLVVTLANAMGGEPIDLTNGTGARVLFEYRDATQRVPITNTNWSVTWQVSDGDNLLETGELAEIEIKLDELTTALSSNTQFALEVKPPSGAVLNIERTTPAYIEKVNDLK